MQDWIIQIMNQYGYIGISLLIAIENIFPPIPSEVILTFGGFMTTYTQMNIWLVILSATIGSLIGAIILYKVGSIFTQERLERWLNGKWGHILHLKIENVNKAFGWFERRGNITVLLCRCVPIVRSLISIPAGMSKMKMGFFLLLTALGSLIWNTILVLLGAAAGKSWGTIINYIDNYTLITIIIIIFVILISGIYFIRKRFNNK